MNRAGSNRPPGLVNVDLVIGIRLRGHSLCIERIACIKSLQPLWPAADSFDAVWNILDKLRPPKHSHATKNYLPTFTHQHATSLFTGEVPEAIGALAWRAQKSRVRVDFKSAP